MEEVELDADALAQILSNLVSNVEKYASLGKLLRIAVSQSAESLEIKVADAGPGIGKRDCGRVFKPFGRLSTRTNDGVSGTGLGLTIARDLAQRMGGSLELEPSDSGAVFVVQLPAKTIHAKNE
jgi:signal transduction histidine kinase